MKTNNPIKLDEISKKSPFTVPDNYFEDFATQMEARLTKEPKKVPLFHKLKPYLYVAAAIAVVLSATLVVFRNGNQDANMLAIQKADTLKLQDTSVNNTLTGTMADNKKKQPVLTKEDENEVYTDDSDDDEQFDDMYADLDDDI